MHTSLSQLVNQKIKLAIRGIDKTEQLQSVIDPELNFKRNSLNLLIGRRGSGKTFNVMRELIKLSELPDMANYNSFIYCTDKSNDNTVNELLSLIQLKTRVISYADMAVFLKDLIDAKNAYDEAIRKGLQDSVTDRCREDLFKALNLDDWTETTTNTVVLYDDAINIFSKAKNKYLVDSPFQNRQCKITFFLCMQDPFGIPPQVKRNLDTCFLFGGFTDGQMLTTIFTQMNAGDPRNDNLKKLYRSLSYRQAMIFDYCDSGTKEIH